MIKDNEGKIAYFSMKIGLESIDKEANAVLVINDYYKLRSWKRKGRAYG
ncbi:MAG: hypothetical protein HQL12_09510 [Candidatus Omnitrophica bacterium]|nr:hypothetical protein [Candidatus Omnitrophota bacterium]